MRLTVNGEPRDTPAATVAELLDDAHPGCAVAVNGVVVPRAELASTPLREHDVVEIVTAVQGG